MANGTPIGTAYVKIMPTAKGISGSISKVLGPEADIAGEQAGKRSGAKFASSLKKALAVAAVGKIVKDAFWQGAALEQSLGGIQTLYKENADQMIKYANEAYKTVGVSANQYMEQVTSFSASLVTSMGGDTAAAAEVANMAMIDMGDNANKMGTSMEDIQYAYQGFAKQNYTMLDNLKLGYGGCRSEMERLLRDAEKITGVKYDISNLDDVYTAIHVIQGELGITGTTAREAEETIAGSFNSMKAAAKDLMGNLALGNDIAPYLTRLVESIFTFAKNMLPAIGNILMGIPKALADSWPQISKGLKQVMDKVKTWMATSAPGVMANLGNFMLKNLPVFIQKLAALLGQIVGYVVRNIPRLVAMAVVALMSALRSLGAAVVGFFQGLWAQIRAAFGNVVAWFGSLFGRAWAAIKAKFAGWGSFWGGLWTKVKNKFKDIGSAVGSAISGAVKGGINAVLGTIERVINKGIDLINKAIGFVDKITPGSIGRVNRLKLPRLAEGGILTEERAVIAGEAGPEAVVPLDAFWGRMEAMANSIVSGVATVAAGAGGYGSDIVIPVYLYPSGPKMGEEIVKAYDVTKKALG